MISVAAELAGVHPQTLRIYEQKGIIKPQRSAGNTRMYSQADIERLELVSQLTSEGINLAGVIRILDLKGQLDKRDDEMDKLRKENTRLLDRVHEFEVRSTITSMVHVDKNEIRPWADQGLDRPDRKAGQ
jgi:MerR family transcriptional regulator/heat shock protein HspR